MARAGTKIPNLAISEVTKLLQSETDGKAIKRLVVAREYLDGASASEIAEKYGFAEGTVYAWLDRFEERPIEEALYDDQSPGRPPALGDAERQRLAETIRRSPVDVGIDAERWTTSLVQQFIRESFGHEYTRRHVRRLLASLEAD